jgi:flagellar hook-length control protein FliK
MQVTVSESLPALAGDLRADKQTNTSDVGSASAFFSEMDKAWKLDDGNNRPQPEGQFTTQVSLFLLKDARERISEIQLNPAECARTEEAEKPHVSVSHLGVIEGQDPVNKPETIHPSAAANEEEAVAATIWASEFIQASAEESIWNISDPSVASAESRITDYGTEFPQSETSWIESSSADGIPQFRSSVDSNPAAAGEKQTAEIAVAAERQTAEAAVLDSVEEIAGEIQGIESSSIRSSSNLSISDADITDNLKDLVLKFKGAAPEFPGQSGSKIQPSGSEVRDFAVSPSSTAKLEAPALPNEIPPLHNLSKAAEIVGAAASRQMDSPLPQNPANVEYLSHAPAGTQNRSISPAMPQNFSEGSHIESDARHLSAPEPRQALFVPSEANPLPRSNGFAGDLLPARDANGQNALNQNADSKKAESINPTSFENEGADDSAANADTRRNSSGSRHEFPGRAENLQVNSGRQRNAAPEGRKGAYSQLLSGTMRAGEAGSSPNAGRVNHSAAQPKEFVSQLAERIQVQLRDGNREIRIQLKPASLGRLEIRVETTNAGIIARITAESSNVKTYLENNLQLLQQNLQDQGLRADRIQIFVQNGFDASSSEGYAPQFGHAGSGQNGETPRRSSRSSPSDAAASDAANQSEDMAVDQAAWTALNPNVRFHTVA